MCRQLAKIMQKDPSHHAKLSQCRNALLLQDSTLTFSTHTSSTRQATPFSS